MSQNAVGTSLNNTFTSLSEQMSKFIIGDGLGRINNGGGIVSVPMGHFTIGQINPLTNIGLATRYQEALTTHTSYVQPIDQQKLAAMQLEIERLNKLVTELTPAPAPVKTDKAEKANIPLRALRNRHQQIGLFIPRY